MSTKPKQAKKSARKKKLNGSNARPKRTKTTVAGSRAKAARNSIKKEAAARLEAAPGEREILIRIGENIRRIRHAKNWSMEKMAEFGFEWRYYQRIEMGKRNLTMRLLVRLAHALEVDIAELMALRTLDSESKKEAMEQ